MITKETQYLIFEETAVPPHFKTGRWVVRNKESGIPLGTIEWYSHWRQYCFLIYTDHGAVYSRSCMKDIIDFIDEQMEKRKA